MGVVALGLLLSACAPGYMKASDLESRGQGPTACAHVCEDLKMKMVAMVLVSDTLPGCVCQVLEVQGAAPAPAPAPAAAPPPPPPAPLPAAPPPAAAPPAPAPGAPPAAPAPGEAPKPGAAADPLPGYVVVAAAAAAHQQQQRRRQAAEKQKLPY